VVFALEVDGRLLVVVNDDVLVRELQVQLPDHAGGEGLLCGVLVVDELDDALDHFVDELGADVGDCCEGNQLRLKCIGDERRWLPMMTAGLRGSNALSAAKTGRSSGVQRASELATRSRPRKRNRVVAAIFRGLSQVFAVMDGD
jgi:hypothetical protein